MLDMGFIPDVRRIMSYLPPKQKRTTMLYSATLNDAVMRLAMNIGNGVMQTASLATTAATTATGYMAGRAQADATEAQAVLQKLQKFLEESEEDLQAILEQIANTGSQLLELLESKTDTLNKINQEIGLQNA